MCHPFINSEIQGASDFWLKLNKENVLKMKRRLLYCNSRPLGLDWYQGGFKSSLKY